MARPFVSYDGVDPQGVRAEVVVEAHTGTVKEVSELDKVAKVTFLGDGLNKPVHGYIQIDDPVLDLIKAAKKSKETVEYRIEVIRKAGVNRSTPMSELRETIETAAANVKKILAGINGSLTKEAVTNPAEDPSADGNYKATDMDPASLHQGTKNSGGNSNHGNPEHAVEVLANAVKAGLPHEALSALVATAIYNGADVKAVMAVAYPEDHAPSVVQHVRSREAAVFMKWNNDGTLNLGSSQVISGVSSENFARRLLAPIEGAKDFDALVEKYASIVLAIADTIQLNAYKNVGSADRMAGSHTRIRGVVYDVIEHHFPFPALNEGFTQEDDFTWVASVGKVAKERFFTAIRISDSAFAFSSLRPVAEAPAKQETVVSPEAPKVNVPVSAPKEAKAEHLEGTGGFARADMKSEETYDVYHVEDGTHLLQETSDVHHVDDSEAHFPPKPAKVTEEESESEEDEDFDFELYDFVEVPEVNPQVPTVKTINSLKNLFVEFNVDKNDFVKVGELLEYSFGKRQAKDVPSDELVKFIEFYKENGAENLIKALNSVEGILNGA